MTLARSRKAEETGCTIVVMLSHQVFLLDCFLIWFGRLWYLKQYQNGGVLSNRSKLRLFVLSGPLEPRRSIFWNISSQGVGRCCFLFFGWKLHLSSIGRSITGREQVLPYYVLSELDKDAMQLWRSEPSKGLKSHWEPQSIVMWCWGFTFVDKTDTFRKQHYLQKFQQFLTVSHALSYMCTILFFYSLIIKIHFNMQCVLVKWWYM